MRPVLIQTIMRRRRKKTVEIKPATQQVEPAASNVMNVLLVILTVIVIGSIAIGA